MKDEYRFSTSDPLNPQDTEKQTYGCRKCNPSSCTKCYAPNLCAFVTEDHICRRPPNSWRSEYERLKGLTPRKELMVQFSAPLKPEDTEAQTYGCRRVAPDTCPHNGESGVCAFVREDHVCKHPSSKWPSMYEELKGT